MQHRYAWGIDVLLVHLMLKAWKAHNKDCVIVVISPNLDSFEGESQITECASSVPLEFKSQTWVSIWKGQITSEMVFKSSAQQRFSYFWFEPCLQKCLYVWTGRVILTDNIKNSCDLDTLKPWYFLWCTVKISHCCKTNVSFCMFTTVSDDSLIIYFNLYVCVCAHGSACVYLSDLCVSVYVLPECVNLTSVHAGTGCLDISVSTHPCLYLCMSCCVFGGLLLQESLTLTLTEDSVSLCNEGISPVVWHYFQVLPIYWSWVKELYCL